MVSCDVCEKWYHFACVGVTQEIEQHPWSCTKCEVATGVQMSSSNANKPYSQTSSQRQKQQAAETESSADLQQKISKQGGTARPAAIVSSVGEKKQDKSHKQQQQRNPVPSQSGSIFDKKPHKKPASLASGSSCRSTQALLKLKLQKLEEEQELERRQAAEKSANEKAFLARKYQLLEEMVNEKSSSSARSYVSEWVDNLTSCNGSQRSVSVAKSDVQRDVQRLKQQMIAGPRHHSSLAHVPQVDNSAQRSLTHQQLASRQAISSGNFQRFPAILRIGLYSYHRSTARRKCVVLQIQKCLRGRAYDAVKCRLMHPANVNGVMATLKMLFGQPEAIIHTLIAKINCLPALREDKLETLVDFAVSIENFCATVDACGVEEYL
ncbi:uncharacterized protein LOC129729344 [Wyeomyia smithii]|uniref:uncharacterized protein LOC129729344 n=1 Tax=Wyeomyia smithii TaxID=174621 RepID=UPI002467CF2E|nr:uncharacterized protein LOC129729344 [Wyeomyia smithii]XP_055543835.1 uncharacterized protein LOC129729344 [Wyeomyia smithii]